MFGGDQCLLKIFVIAQIHLQVSDPRSDPTLLAPYVKLVQSVRFEFWHNQLEFLGFRLTSGQCQVMIWMFLSLVSDPVSDSYRTFGFRLWSVGWTLDLTLRLCSTLFCESLSGLNCQKHVSFGLVNNNDNIRSEIGCLLMPPLARDMRVADPSLREVGQVGIFNVA